jgi:hypothetical protein
MPSASCNGDRIADQAPAGDAQLSVLPALKPDAVGADCRDGVLMVQPSPDPGLHPTALPGGMLHMRDFDLFYANLRDNAALRAAADLAKPQP